MDNKVSKNIFFFINALFVIAANFAHPVTPTLFKSLNLPDYMFGVALAATMTTYFIFSPFWGKISTYIGSKTTLLICLSGYGVGQLLFATANTQGAFVFARAFAGIFTGGSFTAVMTYIVNTTTNPVERSKNLAFSATLQGFVAAFGYFAGGMVGGISPRFAVYVQAGLLFLSGILFFVTCKPDNTLSLKEADKKELIKNSNPLSALAASRKFMNSVWIVLFIICALQNLALVSFDQSFNYFVRDQFAFPSSYNGLIKGVMGLISLVANSTICIYLLTKTDYKKSIIFVLAAAGTFGIGLLVFTSVPPFIVSVILMFAANSISLPILQNMVAERPNGGESNLVMGVYSSTKSFGGIFGALFAGGLYTLNPRLPFAFSVGSYFLAALLSVLYCKKNRAEIAAQSENQLQ